jgi:hypothetical protein
MWMLTVCILLANAFVVTPTKNFDSVGSKREKKLLPIFQVVRFPNDPCASTSATKNGTCYTTEECSNKGGTSGGTCAEGFGVCCIFTLTCGSTGSENCTYFEFTSAVAAGACRAKICKCNTNICKLRLDFTSFVITGPSTSVTSVIGLVNGVATTPDGTATTPAVTTNTQCLTDVFSVTNQVHLPQICGTMTGEHVFVDASDNCNSLDFTLGDNAIDIAAIATRSVSIKVSQLSCHDPNLPPIGCDQWFYNTDGTGYITTFNYQNKHHLASQKQSTCIRRERGNCRMCLSADVPAIDIKISGIAIGVAAIAVKNQCCGFGIAGIAAAFSHIDCIIIPGATTVIAIAAAVPVSNSQCGGGLGLINALGATATVCTTVLPFRVEFLTNQWEFEETMEVVYGTEGFKLRYFQTAC